MKTFLLIIIYRFSSSLHAQHLTKKQSKELFEKTIQYLKTNDTLSFVNMWHYEKAMSNNEKHFDEKLAKLYFGHIKTWMDTAFATNLTVDHIEIEKQDNNDEPYLGQYLIKAWFKYNDHYSKGFGFYVDNLNRKWYYHNKPETSAAWNN